jgi:hypothetical protein
LISVSDFFQETFNLHKAVAKNISDCVPVTGMVIIIIFVFSGFLLALKGPIT